MSQLQVVYSAQKSYFNEHKTYSSSLRDIGYLPEGKLRGTLYLNPSDIPGEISKNLHKDVLPFVDKESFRALYLIRKGREFIGITVDDKWEFVHYKILL